MLGIVMVLLAATGFGLLPLLSRHVYAAGITPDVATFYRFGVPAAVFAPFLTRLRHRPREAAIAVATGLFTGVAVLGYFRALSEMPVANAALIFFTFPLFAVAIGYLGFGLRPDRRSLLGAVLVVIACALFVNPSDFSARPLIMAHAFMAPVAYATLILVISYVLANLDRMALLAGIYAGTALSSGVNVLVHAPSRLLPSSLDGQLAALGLVTIGGILPQLALTFGAPATGPTRTSVLAAFELVVALACGWLVIGEPARPTELASAALILTAVVLAALARPVRSVR
jgi:drug/metabolite transporter (DMT)-like permease